MGSGSILFRHICSWLILAACVQVSHASTRAIFQVESAPLLQIAPYKQCGGTIKCPTDTTCSDAAWAGSVCPEGYVCTRFDQFYWQCRRPGDMEAGPAAATTATTPQLLTASAWAQCGGSLCPSLADKSICSDRVWATCPTGLTCLRRDQWYYQCRDKPFPASAAAVAAAAAQFAPVPPVTAPLQQQQQGAATAGLTAQAWTQCGGSTCPGVQDQTICGDKPWAACPDGLSCYRRDQWYWQCRDKPFPAAVSRPAGPPAAAAAVTTVLTAQSWTQCGGSTCPGVQDKSICNDEPWAACPGGLTCHRRDQWYWQCRDKPFPAAATVPPTAAAAVSAGLTAQAWTQCGGSTCPGVQDKSVCADKPWSTCPSGLTCYRRDQWYWQCRDKPFLVVAAAAAAAAGGRGSQGVPSQLLQQQLSVDDSVPTAEAWKQCGGATCLTVSDKSVCGDKPWAACPDGFECLRRDRWYYQCRDTPFPAHKPSRVGLFDQSVGVVPTVTASTAAVRYRLSGNAAPDPVVTEVPDGALEPDVDVLQSTGN